MDAYKLTSLLKTCIAQKSLGKGKLLHSKSITLGLIRTHPQLSKTLISFYISLNLLSSAHHLLLLLHHPLISSWNSLISAYTSNQMHPHSLSLFSLLRRSSPPLSPDAFTFPSVLKSCAASGELASGASLHSLLLKSAILSDLVVSTSLLSMYARCGLLPSAAHLFDEMPLKDVACYNTLISSYQQAGQHSLALDVFDEMLARGLGPDAVTFTSTLSACARLLDLDRGRSIHREVGRSGLEGDVFVGTALVDMYGRCRCLDSAREAFEKMPHDKSVVTWNAMLGGYASAGNGRSCLEIFSRMNAERVRPTSTTLSNLLMAFSRNSDLKSGKFVHGYMMRNGIKVDTFVECLLTDLYFKCGNAGGAESLLERMPKEETITWNVAISGHAAAGCSFEALADFQEMKARGVRPDTFTFASVLSACAQLAALEQGKEIHRQISELRLERDGIVMCVLLDMYAKCGAVREARLVFDGLHDKDTVSWTSMIMAYGSHGQTSEALEVFNGMVEAKVRPDHVTFLAVISACGHGGLVDEGCRYFDQMMNEYGIRPRTEHLSCLIDLLGRSGRLREAFDIVRSLPEITVDAGLLGSLLSACSFHGNLEIGEEAAKFLVEIDPDDHSTYVVLSNMYASASNWNEVRKLRATMRERGLKKNPGCSWIEIDKRIHQFYVEDDSHQHIASIFECLGVLSMHMEKDRSKLRRKKQLTFHILSQ